jgi:hypothetical protein
MKIEYKRMKIKHFIAEVRVANIKTNFTQTVALLLKYSGKTVGLSTAP